MKSDIELNYLAQKLRKDLGADLLTPIDIISIAENIPEFTLVFYNLGDHISGLCYKDVNLIAVNISHTYGRVRFTLAHEFYHYFYDSENPKIICLQMTDDAPDNEKEADRFASYFLAPYDAFKNSIVGISKENITEKKIIGLEQYYGMSRIAMLYRLRQEGIIILTGNRIRKTL
jgi:Zn-dependent peptidase ImmA (M78 family)